MRKAISKGGQKQPQLPGKNNKQKVVATVEGMKNNASYSRSKKVNFIAKTIYNEDDEDFEEIECPKEEASAMLCNRPNNTKENNADEKTHFV